MEKNYNNETQSIYFCRATLFVCFVVVVVVVSAIVFRFSFILLLFMVITYKNNTKLKTSQSIGRKRKLKQQTTSLHKKGNKIEIYTNKRTSIQASLCFLSLSGWFEWLVRNFCILCIEK